MNYMLVLEFYTSSQAFTLITSETSQDGSKVLRFFLVSMLGLTTSRDGF